MTVTAEAPVLDLSHTEVSSVVDQQQIESLPINGRNFISFTVITPGVSTDRTPQQGASATSGLSFGGQRARSNNIMVDGLDNNAVIGVPDEEWGEHPMALVAAEPAPKERSRSRTW